MLSRKCPSCDKKIQYDENYSFDKNNSLICGNCGGLVFPTNYESNRSIEDGVDKKKRNKTYSPYYYRKNQVTKKLKKKVSVKPKKEFAAKTYSTTTGSSWQQTPKGWQQVPNKNHTSYSYPQNNVVTTPPNKLNNQDQICHHL